jgi:hypothetical protein
MSPKHWTSVATVLLSLTLLCVYLTLGPSSNNLQSLKDRGHEECAIDDSAWSLSFLSRTRYSTPDLSILPGVLKRRVKGDVSRDAMLILRFRFRVFEFIYCNATWDMGLRQTKTGWFWWMSSLSCFIDNYRPVRTTSNRTEKNIVILYLVYKHATYFSLKGTLLIFI